MPCYHPNIAWHNGEKIIVAAKGAIAPPYHKSFRLPCGGCLGCRIDHAQTWATRCVHEAQMNRENQFITLTYNDQNLPPFPHSLDPKHHRLFIRRLRKYYPEKTIRYYHCGEYGVPTMDNDFIARPHFHTLIFGHEFTDLEVWREEEGIITYTSEILDEIWGLGECKIGELNHDSAGYVARYCLKKITGEKAQEHYEKVCPITLSIQNVRPEYATMSRRPGIAKSWYDKYKKDVFPSDQLVIGRGNKVKTPRYYDLLLQHEEEETYIQIKEKRNKEAEKSDKDSTRKRLATRETVKKAQLTQLHRNKI